MKFPSSIFNFEALRSVDVPRHWWASIVLMFILLAGAEAGARYLMGPIGDNLWAYGSAGFSRSFEWYRHLANNGVTPEVIVIGDSTGARNFDPVAFAKASGVEGVYSLARAGNFPLALRSNTLPLLATGKPPEFVVLLQWPGSLRDDPRVQQIESGALSPILEARQADRFLITDFSYVSRLFQARTYLVSYWLRGEALLYPPENLGYSPFFREAEVESTAIAPSAPRREEAFFSPERQSVIRELVDLAHERGFLVVAVVGPFRAGEHYSVANQHLEWLRSLGASACGSLAVVDLRQPKYLDSSQFKDNNHLYSDGAALFSSNLADVISGLRQQSVSRQTDCEARQNSS